jgi:polyadenylate-binding protein
MATQTQAPPAPAAAAPGAPAGPAKDAAASYASASLYVGDLLPEITEANLCDIFNQVGPVQSIRVCRDAVTRRPLGYAYVNFRMMQDAERALDTMNYSLIKGHPCRIMWSHRDPALRKSNKGNIFIKNLDKSIDNKMLYDTFSTFGNILSCKIATDEDNKSKGYGFVHYEDESSCQAAIDKVNGKMLKDKIVYVGPFKSRREREDEQGGPLEQLYSNVFVKNIDESITEEEFKAMFEKYGNVTSFVLKSYEDGAKKGFQPTKYGFVNYDTPEAAKACCDAINETEVKGRTLYCGPAEKMAKRKAKLKAQFDKIKADQIAKYQNVNLYVKNLDDTVTEENLKEIFEPFGVITSAKLMMDGTASKGFGFVCFTTPEEATKAVTEMNNKLVGTKPIYVSLAQRKDQRRAQLEAQMAQRFQQQRMPQGQGYYQQGPMGAGFYAPQMAGYPQQGYAMGGRPQYQGKGGVAGGQYMNQGKGKGSRRGGKGEQQKGGPKGGPRQGAKGGPQGGKGAAMPQGAPQNPNSWAAKAGTPMPVPAAQPQQAPPADAPPAQPDLAQQLAAAAPQQQKQILGEKLYPIIEKHPSVLPDQAGKITGMLLDMDVSELLNLYEAPDALHQKVIEAINVLAHHGMATPVDPATGKQIPAETAP